MLFVFAGLIVLIASVLFIIKKDEESILIWTSCVLLAFVLWFACLFIAKKGGISGELQFLLYFNAEVRYWFQYQAITLRQMGFCMAIGKFLFPYFFLLLAMRYSMALFIQKIKWCKIAFAILPVLWIVLYMPVVFDYFTERYGVPFQKAMVVSSRGWTVFYVLLALVLLAVEYHGVTIRFLKRAFLWKALMLAFFAMLYLLYGLQDPAQVYQFYNDSYMSSLQIWYFSPHINMLSYRISLTLSAVFVLIGFSTLLKYTQVTFQEGREDLVMERKFNIAGQGVSFFVHSVKNQLLANKIIHRKLAQLKEQNAPMEDVWHYIKLLEESNGMMITRMEELYNAVKTKSLTLTELDVSSIIETACKKFYKKYPDGEIAIKIQETYIVLADEIYMSEAIYNLLVNAWEATLAASRQTPIEVTVKNERKYTAIQIKDNGTGIAEKNTGKIFEPFYSNKNSNYNWGMGLYFVKSIVKSHFGVLRVESDGFSYSQFLLLLPKYS